MLPFSADQFFDVFAAYNEAVWPMQYALFAIAIISIVLSVSKRSKSTDRGIGSLLAILWAWMAVAYHFKHFAAVNSAAYVFGAAFLVQAALLLWFSWRNDEPIRFSLRKDAHGALSGMLLVFALVGYPVLTEAFGHDYPRAPTFGVPCPTTIFTLGMLSAGSHPRMWQLMVVPMIWVVIGGSAAFLLDVPQDLGLIAAGVLAAASLIVRRGTRSNSA